jgi:hypothetical protein
MRATFGEKIRIVPIPADAPIRRDFLVLDYRGNLLERFGVFKVGTGGIQEWAWQGRS